MENILNNYSYVVDLLNPFFLVFILGHSFKMAVESALDWSNSSNKSNLTNKIKALHKMHPLMNKFLTASKIRKSLEYNSDHKQFSDFVSGVQSSISTIFLLLGISPAFLHFIINATPNLSTTLHYIIFTISLMFVKTIFDAPFEYKSTFGIEEKWGFNKMTKGLFLADQIKSFIIGSILSSLAIYLLNLGFNYFGRLGYKECAYITLGIIAFSLFMEFVSLHVIMPLFNKFTPLKDKKLTAKLQKLFNAYGYSTKCIYVMDGSKRSNHSNAFICGFGGKKHKKIVLFDTLLKKYTPEEITAILGHELAHGKLGHLFINRIFSIFSIAITIFLTAFFMYDLSLYHAFGFNFISEENVIQYQLIGFSLFGMVLSSLTWLKEPLDAFISRKMEYAADKMSVKITKNKKAMVSSLIKLEAENLSDPFPSKEYERWNYDHPSLINRINAILNSKKKVNVK